MSKRSKSKRAGRKLRNLICVLVVIIVIAVLLKIFAIEPLKEKAAGIMTEQLFKSQLSSDENLDADIDTEEILNSMEPEDREKLEEIAEDKISPQTIKDASEYIKNGDKEGLKEYAKESLSEEEIQEVKDLYEKYKDDIMQNIK